jgi:hypothetical protein
MFEKRRIAIATMHQKETVIAPLLQQAFASTCLLPKNINTDLLGTFSGEIERKDTPLNTARKKCLLAMELTGCDLAIASEGSFGSHPVYFFSPANEELVLLVDKKNNLEIFAIELSTDTNIDGILVESLQETEAFASKIKFPSHGLIVRDKKDSNRIIHKDILTNSALKKIVSKVLSEYGSAWIETDMRAMRNPTRMNVIQKATKNLISKIESKCPACNLPGFWIIAGEKGLPCSSCNSPTNSTLAHLYGCVKCSYQERKEFPNLKLFEDPTFCDYCNP